MVGFGSTFRISRRHGWENAYVDYETLKLLLTQIEAVYEEAASIDMTSDDLVLKGLQGFNINDDNRFSSTLTNRRRKANRSKRNAVKDWRNELFAESDTSVAYGSSDSESEISYGVADSDKEESDQFYPSLMSETKYNFSYDSIMRSHGSSGSLNKALSSASASRESSHHTTRKLSFGLEENHPSVTKIRVIQNYPVKSGFGNFGRKNKRDHKKLHHQKKMNKVPKHLRKAHEKARSITERFLGLLRAEVDKVFLFVHARFGELSDTIGSIRFPTDLEFGFNPDNPLSDGGIHPSASSSSGMSSDDDYEDDATRKMNDSMNYKRRRNRTHVSSNLYSERLINAIHLRKDENSRKDNHEGFNSSALRQIDLAEEFRKSTPIFQRSEQIFGEDFSLLSAVDEADSFAAVGVELLHVLRYVCINVIAIARLCQKHDRLLSNRMLGGYYHRLRKEGKTEVFHSKSSFTHSTPKRSNMAVEKNSTTKYYNYTPVGHHNDMKSRNHFLFGLVDSQVRSLCNSSIADTLVESLKMALSEFEISRQRADALATLHKKKLPRDHENSFDSISSLQESSQFQNFPPTKNLNDHRRKSRSEDTNSEDNYDNFSTSSAVSLARLRFVVASIHTLRAIASESRSVFSEFVERSLISMDVQGFIGQPRGLNNCSKNTLDIYATYNPDYALILGPEFLQQALEDSYTSSNNTNALNISKTAAIVIRINAQAPNKSSLLQRINLVINVLGVMNYYIVIPSAWSFCSSLGWRPGHSPLLVGSMNLTILLSSILQIYYLRCLSNKNLSFQKLFLIAPAFGFVGNILYSKSYEWKSLPLAMLSRLVVGLSSSEILSKEVMSAHTCGNNTFAFKLRFSQLLAVLLSFLFGNMPGVNKMVELGPLSIQLSFETFPSYLLAMLWFLAYLWILLSVIMQNNTPTTSAEPVFRDHSESIIDYNESKSHSRRLSFPEMTKKDSFSALIEHTFSGSLEESYRDAYFTKEVVEPTKQLQMTELLKRTNMLLRKNVAVPITLLLYCLSCILAEVLLTSSTMITNRYFMWSLFSSGMFLVFLSVLIFPSYFAASYLSVMYGERYMIRKLIHLIVICLLCSTNIQALLEIFRDVKNIFSDTEPDKPQSTYYDWSYGVVQYILLVPIIFCCALSLDGLSSNLLSKVSSEKLNNSIINPSTLAPLTLSFGRLCGDGIICLVSFSHRLINTDMINSISFALIPLCIYTYYMIKKHYFYLQGGSR